MRLKSFKVIKENGELVREITFHNGLNLIVGLPSNSKSSSTNGLGKTTLLRCIDFCLAGEIKQLYEDQESKNRNEQVYQFLFKNNPSFILTVEDKNNSVTTIKRSIDLSKKKDTITNIINEEIYSLEKFKDKLNLLFFRNINNKPSFRQLIPKFIRKDEDQISKILKYLHSATADIDYEAIHSFLFGFEKDELLKQKLDLSKKIKNLKNKKSIISNGNNKEHELEQLLLLLEKEIKELTNKRDSFQINEAYEKDENKLQELQLSIIKINNNIEKDEIKIINAEKRVASLSNRKIDKSHYELEYLYNEVSHYIEKVDKKFEELVNFHNSMLENEKRYLSRLIKRTKDNLSNLYLEKNNLISQYNEILAILGKTGSLQEYTKLSHKIDTLLLDYGDKSAIYNIIKDINDQIKEKNNKLLKVQKDIEKGEDSFKEKITIFNNFFSEISYNLYGKKYFLYYSDEDIKKFQIRDFTGNPGSGEKQTISIAFDLAYIQFINHLNLVRPQFTMHDKVELIDINKYQILFNLVNSLDGQLIFPVIYDKVESIFNEIRNNVILELDSSHKFFNV
ncbi:hypothetical protein I926_09550 [Pasteurella multocida subsp. multocida OH4807]|nr:hypothetical protein I926_09550 [Pasteurella multocida subsp. multocida OH4807]